MVDLAMLSRNMKNSRVLRSIYNSWLRYRNSGVKSFVFCATTGRSGTKTLAQLVATCPNVVAYHEAYPRMKNDVFERYGLSMEEVFHNIKRLVIRKSVLGYDHYFESNHLFITNYASYAIEEFGSKLRVIHLVRDPVEVAMSFYSIGSIPDDSVSGKLWMPSIYDDMNVVRFGDRWKNLDHPFYKCLWFWFEVQARVMRLMESHPHIPVVLMKTEDLNNIERIERVFGELGFNVDRKAISSVVGRVHNKKVERKKTFIDKDEAQEMYNEIREMLEESSPKVFMKLKRAGLV